MYEEIIHYKFDEIPIYIYVENNGVAYPLTGITAGTLYMQSESGTLYTVTYNAGLSTLANGIIAFKITSELDTATPGKPMVAQATVKEASGYIRTVWVGTVELKTRLAPAAF